ncbi:hypothetical protein Droror1_Dr00023893 [Drosera rotundifolia]
MDRWDTLQSRLVSKFSNASFIIDQLQVIRNKKNYGALKCVEGIEEAVLHNQMETLNTILVSINRTMEEFHGIVLSLQKIVCDGRQLVKGGIKPLSAKQLQQRIGVKPCVVDCFDGLAVLHEMYKAEYLLKSSVVSTLPKLALKSSMVATDLSVVLSAVVESITILMAMDELAIIFQASMLDMPMLENESEEMTRMTGHAKLQTLQVLH